MDTETKAQLADVYEKAAEYLEEYGWVQTMILKPHVPTCFMGAVYQQVEEGVNDWLYYEAAKYACGVLELGVGGPATLGGWNDDPNRTKDEVINTLHALANKLR